LGILMIGEPGRDAVRALLPDLKPKKAIHFVICNGENTAGGYGSPRTLPSNSWGVAWTCLL